MRKTFSAWRRTSSAPMKTSQSQAEAAPPTVAVATPCWPAPVSAMMPRLAHAPREQRLADRVVDLVRAGVAEVLALQVDPRAAERARQTLREVERRRPADVVAQALAQLAPEARVAPRAPDTPRSSSSSAGISVSET